MRQAKKPRGCWAGSRAQERTRSWRPRKACCDWGWLRLEAFRHVGESASGALCCVKRPAVLRKDGPLIPGSDVIIVRMTERMSQNIRRAAPVNPRLRQYAAVDDFSYRRADRSGLPRRDPGHCGPDESLPPAREALGRHVRRFRAPRPGGLQKDASQ
jgi:hypothetical protein